MAESARGIEIEFPASRFEVEFEEAGQRMVIRLRVPGDKVNIRDSYHGSFNVREVHDAVSARSELRRALGIEKRNNVYGERP